MSVKIQDRLTPKLQRIQKRVQALPEKALEVFVNNTPVLSGNARRRTRLNQNQIQARYPYAEPLDGGSSRKSPQGMTEPTLKFLKREYPKQFRK